jgi:hypothetical protein
MNLREYNELAERLAAPAQYRGAVITVHGMNTRGKWQKDINTALQDAGIRHKPVDYGWRLGSVLRKKTADRVAADILAAYEDHRRHVDDPGALGHSFGTLAIGRALQIFPDIRLRRIVLFGSILPCDFPWDQIHANGQIEAVLNEMSASDVWPKVAPYCIPRSGRSGVDGFTTGAAFITSRNFEWTGHSGLSYELHCRESWIPFLIGH